MLPSSACWLLRPRPMTCHTFKWSCIIEKLDFPTGDHRFVWAFICPEVVFPAFKDCMSKDVSDSVSLYFLYALWTWLGLQLGLAWCNLSKHMKPSSYRPIWLDSSRYFCIGMTSWNVQCSSSNCHQLECILYISICRRMWLSLYVAVVSNKLHSTFLWLKIIFGDILKQLIQINRNKRVWPFHLSVQESQCYDPPDPGNTHTHTLNVHTNIYTYTYTCISHWHNM